MKKVPTSKQDKSLEGQGAQDINLEYKVSLSTATTQQCFSFGTICKVILLFRNLPLIPLCPSFCSLCSHRERAIFLPLAVWFQENVCYFLNIRLFSSLFKNRSSFQLQESKPPSSRASGLCPTNADIAEPFLAPSPTLSF